MGDHLIDGEFQSDKYPTCPRGKVPLSVKDPAAQDLLWEYAQRRRIIDDEFSADLEAALVAAGFTPNAIVGEAREMSGENQAAVLRYVRALAAGPVDREALGREVRAVWVTWAAEQPNPKPSWLVPWEILGEPDREVDRRIGERLFAMGRASVEG